MFEKTFKITITVLGIIFAIVAAISLVTRTFDITKVGDKFDLFRDLLLVLLAFAAVIGVAIYKIVGQSIKDEVMKSVRVEEITRRMMEISRERGRNLISVGVDYCERGDITRAITRTREALTEVGLDEPNIIMANNNLAYYLAAKFKETKVEQHAAEALRLAEEVYAEYDTTNELYNYPEWVETWVFVKANTTVNEEEIKSLAEKIKEFLGRDDLKSKHISLRQHLFALQSRIDPPTGDLWY